MCVHSAFWESYIGLHAVELACARLLTLEPFRTFMKLRREMPSA
jgi:hypothetical protein